MIGILDSGIGGLTIARALADHLPNYDIIYFGDTARGDYGEKSAETITEYALHGADFLSDKGAKVIIIACHAISAIAAEQIAQRFDMPVFEGIAPSAKLAVQNSRKGQIGVIGTRALIYSGIYEKKIKALNPKARVYSAACPLLVPLIEEGWLKKPETRMIVKKYLHPLKVRQIDTLILGCAHYPIIKDMIQRKIGKRVSLAEPCLTIPGQVKAFLENHPKTDTTLTKNGELKIFVSDMTKQTEKIAKRMFSTCLKVFA